MTAVTYATPLGLVIVDTQRLKEREYRTLVKHQLLTGISLTVSMLLLYLTLLTTLSLDTFTLTTLSLGGHVLYRLYQMGRPLHFWYRNHDTCSDGHPYCPLTFVKNKVVNILQRTTRKRTWRPAGMEQQQETVEMCPGHGRGRLGGNIPPQTVLTVNAEPMQQQETAPLGHPHIGLQKVKGRAGDNELETMSDKNSPKHFSYAYGEIEADEI